MRPVRSIDVGRSFACRGHVCGTVVLENFFGFLCPVGVVAVDGEENSSVFHATFVALGLILGQAKPDKAARYASNCSAGASSSQRCQDWPCGNEWSQPRYRERADPG